MLGMRKHTLQMSTEQEQAMPEEYHHRNQEYQDAE
jgi:hypothetical protein